MRCLVMFVVLVGLAFSANYAVIIQGCGPTMMFQEGQGISPIYQERYQERWFMDEFWQDPLLLWQALRSGGVPQENIFVLWGDGSQWGYNDTTYQPRYRVPYVDMPCTRKNLDSICAYLADILTNEDILFVYTFDHGGENTLCLYDGVINDNELANLLNAIPHRYRWIGMQQCHSGSFIDVLQNEKTVMMTSTDSLHPAWRADDILVPGGTIIYGIENEIYEGRTYNHGEWNFHLLTGFWGGLMPSLYWPNPIFRDSIDTDANGKISLAEIHNWILARDSRPYEFPQLSDPSHLAENFYVWPEIEVTVGVVEKPERKEIKCLVQVYPNPSSGKINFIPPMIDEPLIYKLYNSSGQLVVATSESKIEIKTAGIYFYKILYRNGQEIQTGKIVIVK